MSTYDVAVIGAGPGGYVAAIRAAQLKMKVALIERGATLGGTCLNVGCIPSKALLESSELWVQANHDLASHGIVASGLSFDLSKMLQRKQQIVTDLCGGVALLMKKNNVSVFQGAGEFRSATELVVRNGSVEQVVKAARFIIATGSAAVELPMLPFNGSSVISSTEALSLTTVPKRLGVIGAGAIGLELGSVWGRLGADVTVIELLPRIVPPADEQMSKTLQTTLQKQGMKFLLGHKLTGGTATPQSVTLQVQPPEGDVQSLTFDCVLVAVGRRPFSDGLGLDRIGVTLDDRRRIVVDHQYQTVVPNIYAIGDVIAGPMLAHKAEDEGVAVAELLAGRAGHVNYEAIPSVVYTWPELAWVGKTEHEAKNSGVAYRVGKYPFKPNGRAKTLGASDGLVKIIADEKTDKILGVHIVGVRASDMIAELVLALEFSASAEDVARTTHAHPSLAEIIKEAAMAVDGRAIHG